MAKHLTLEERQFLYRLSKNGKSIMEIAKLTGRDRSTIYRELNRNTGQRGYRPKQAQHLADERRLASRRPHKMENPDVHCYVQDRLEKYWSPDQIAGRVRDDFPRSPARWLSRQTIYDWINYQSPDWRSLLRRGGRPPERRGRLTDCVRIDGRPDVINRRRRYGDWEGDTIVGAHHKGALLTHVERKSLFTTISKLPRPTAQATHRATVHRLTPLRAHVHTITYDNGKEFAGHRHTAHLLQAQVFFATPYHAWERGVNENTNGLIRDFFPKGTDFTTIHPATVAKVERLLNRRPRKSLGFQTPNEVFHALAKRG
jgi:IS30 family transposase